MRLVLAIACLTLLGACNMVVTKDPMFTKADEAGAPPLREGVWVETPAAPCVYDETKPVADWPACAQAWVIKDHTAGGYQAEGDKRVWSATDFVLAAGDPRIIQIFLADSGPGDELLPKVYIYADIEPTRIDSQGRITAYRSWAALCGPPPPSDAKGPDGTVGRIGTLAPMAGLTMDDKGVNCSPASRDVLRAAAKASRAWATDIEENHWVRDGDK